MIVLVDAVPYRTWYEKSLRDAARTQEGPKAHARGGREVQLAQGEEQEDAREIHGASKARRRRAASHGAISNRPPACVHRLATGPKRPRRRLRSRGQRARVLSAQNPRQEGQIDALNSHRLSAAAFSRLVVCC